MRVQASLRAVATPRYLTALLAVAAVLAWPHPDRAGAALKPLNTGVSYVYGSEPIEFAHVRHAGARLVQTPLRWASVAPRTLPANWNPEDPADPHYSWEATDIWVKNAVEAGLTPLLQVRGAPLWAQQCPSPTSTDAPCKPLASALAAFATAAARRYSGRFGDLPQVRYWQALNETNLSLFFEPQFENGKAVSANLYRPLLNAFTAAVKSVDSSDLVIAAGLGPIAVPGYTIGPMQFARELLCMKGREHPRPQKGDCGGGVHFDIFDIHPYTTGGPTHQGGKNDVELGDLSKLQTLLGAADRAGRIVGQFNRTPLWITEFSWDSKPPDPGGLPMDIEKQWIPEALYHAWQDGIGNFFWFSLSDFPPEPQLPFSETLQSGLYFWAPHAAEQQPKELLASFRFPFVAIPRSGGLFIWGRTPTSEPGKVAIQVWRRGHWRRATVVRADRDGLFTGTLHYAYGRSGQGAVRARYEKQSSPAFPMRRVGDFVQPPFG
jgi:hypothetical protein